MHVISSLSRGAPSSYGVSAWRKSISTSTSKVVQIVTRRSLQAMASGAKSADTPRPSASVIVVNHLNEILLVHRNPKSQSFGGVHVFPGGNYDEKQDDTLELTAIREVFEETGLLLASSSANRWPSDAELDDSREAIHAQRQLFRDFLSRFTLTPDTSSLLPFTQWITPPTMPRRFHTNFYVTFLDSASATGFTSGGKREQFPTPDGGKEVIEARFVHPQKALAECRAHQIALMPPQVYLLDILADILRSDRNTDSQRDRVRALSTGTFGRIVFQPHMLSERDADGNTIMTYEGDETRGGPKGRLHRSLVKWGKGGIATDVVVQRTFDVFSDSEARSAVASSKF
ncbi:uncharacterized protein LAESUDRAFT_520859 [Laetiporus sulphureus 93-53]|uniref:Nudix hydrolase domain-containing protein n=1 Tax=Laetiporus sulphureus 93-53 TaxID=1314785 RepID=A0A165G3P3_9APHY|nr:uncharacterized protein LAESUDRAFT_520859 [Laetiporus sulphureus 93-53]KZT09784.1 hypothetical protein LAESUDRAFT_520859 [Laetiporus sulphureus 93-53]